MPRSLPLAVALGPEAALAHTGAEHALSFAAGLQASLTGLDHMLAMVAVGLWAGLDGGRALWVWPVAFVGVMVLGGSLGFAGIAVPMVEAGILASVVSGAAGAGGGARAGRSWCGSGRCLRPAAWPRARRRAAERGRSGDLRGGFRHRHGACCTPSASAWPTSPATRTDGSPCGRGCGWSRLPASPGDALRRRRMIPGEVITAPGDIELNAGRPVDHAHRRQHRRPADPGRLALSFRRDQRGPAVRPRQGARPPPRHRRRHRRALRARPDARRAAGAVRRRPPGVRLPGKVMGAL